MGHFQLNELLKNEHHLNQRLLNLPNIIQLVLTQSIKTKQQSHHGGFVVWFLWIESAPIGLYLVNLTTAGLDDAHFLKVHLIESVPYFRFLMMGIGLLLIMRYRPKGILPEKIEIK